MLYEDTNTDNCTLLVCGRISKQVFERAGGINIKGTKGGEKRKKKRQGSKAICGRLNKISRYLGAEVNRKAQHLPHPSYQWTVVEGQQS